MNEYILCMDWHIFKNQGLVKNRKNAVYSAYMECLMHFSLICVQIISYPEHVIPINPYIFTVRRLHSTVR